MSIPASRTNLTCRFAKLIVVLIKHQRIERSWTQNKWTRTHECRFLPSAPQRHASTCMARKVCEIVKKLLTSGLSHEHGTSRFAWGSATRPKSEPLLTVDGSDAPVHASRIRCRFLRLPLSASLSQYSGQRNFSERRARGKRRQQDIFFVPFGPSRHGPFFWMRWKKNCCLRI